MATIKAVTMWDGKRSRLVYCVVLPTGRVAAERLTLAGAQRAATQEG